MAHPMFGRYPSRPGSPLESTNPTVKLVHRAEGHADRNGPRPRSGKTNGRAPSLADGYTLLHATGARPDTALLRRSLMLLGLAVLAVVTAWLTQSVTLREGTSFAVLPGFCWEAPRAAARLTYRKCTKVLARANLPHPETSQGPSSTLPAFHSDRSAGFDAPPTVATGRFSQ
jgi:hypothetical protein